MAPKAPGAHPRLPNELCREIIENLHHFRDRHALVCLALVSKSWCAESQRVLFRTVSACDNTTDLIERKSLIQTHAIFLNAIILNPTRLGPHVQAYEQHSLICHPMFAADSEHPLSGAFTHLWDLTAEALPALVNLKHLSIVPSCDDRRILRVSLLEGCTFRLESLRWGFESYNRSRTDPFVEFLRTQHDLVHLEVGWEASWQDLSWLPDDICPSLTSTSGELESAAHVMTQRKNMVALTISLPVIRHSFDLQPGPQDLSALCRLQYLRMAAHMQGHLRTIDLNIILLEIKTYIINIKTVDTLPALPKLRVLALVRDESLDARFGFGDINVMEEYNLRIPLTIEIFHRCPSLEYIIIQEIARGEGPRRYRKMFISGLNGGADTIPDIQSEEFSIEHEPGMPWWAAYGVQ